MNNPTKSNKIQQLDITKLSVKQQAAIELLTLGKTDTEVAQVIEVGRDTVNRWRNHHIYFIKALDERREQKAYLQSRTVNLYAKAIDVIERELDLNNSKVAIAILRTLIPAVEQTSIKKKVEQLILQVEEEVENTNSYIRYSPS